MKQNSSGEVFKAKKFNETTLHETVLIVKFRWGSLIDLSEIVQMNDIEFEKIVHLKDIKDIQLKYFNFSSSTEIL